MTFAVSMLKDEMNERRLETEQKCVCGVKRMDDDQHWATVGMVLLSWSGFVRANVLASFSSTSIYSLTQTQTQWQNSLIFRYISDLTLPTHHSFSQG